ncbi:1165_t:CDS:2, partial [Racocetra persica]
QVLGPVKVEVLVVRAPAKLPGYKQYSGAIEKILQQHHMTQKCTATINASPILKILNRARMNKNTRVNE